jgi:hypothetical protein
MRNKEYEGMRQEFKKWFGRDLTDDEIAHKKGGVIPDEDFPMGSYVWDDSQDFIEYYIQWMPRFRGDDHGIIYKDGRHEPLMTFNDNNFLRGELSQEETAIRKELVRKGLLDF